MTYQVMLVADDVLELECERSDERLAELEAERFAHLARGRSDWRVIIVPPDEPPRVYATKDARKKKEEA